MKVTIDIPDPAMALEWLEDLLRFGGETSRDAPPGPTATEVLAADRDRLNT